MTTADLYGGHSVPLRALEIAWTGDHSILLWGPVGSGKRTLASCFPIPVIVQQSCYCGHYASVAHACYCPERMLRRARWTFERLVRDVDIAIEVCPIPVRDALGPKRGEREHAMLLERVRMGKEQLAQTGELRIEDSGNRILEMAARRLALSVGQLESIKRVGRTIAVLGGETKVIPGKAIAEATQYLALRWPEYSVVK